MTIHVFWDDSERTILRFDGEGEWTWQDFDRKVDEAMILARSARTRIDVITILIGPMASGSPIPHYQRAWKHLPDNVCTVVVVQHDPHAQAMYRLMTQLSSKIENSSRTADTLEEARALVRSLRIG
jgi:hypothetical protein